MSETAVAPLVEQPNPAQEAKDARDEPSTDVYHNPLESSSRMGLAAKAYAYRAGASIAFGMGNMVTPAVPSPQRTIYLDSTLSKQYSGKNKIKADIWTPDRPRTLSRKSSRNSTKSKDSSLRPGESNGDTDTLRPTLSRYSSKASFTDDEYASGNERKKHRIRPSLSRLSSRMSTKSSKSITSTQSKSSISLVPTPTNNPPTSSPMDQIPTMLTPQADPRSRRPAVINFHGGGFVLGQATDDGRWAMAVMQALGAVVFSVEYRLAPSYPFPTPVEDCADAILQIWRRADEFWIDRDRIMVSGFSAGGTLSLASWVLLNDYKRHGYDVTASISVPADDDVGGSDGDEACHTKDPNIPQIAGLMLFYPLLDWTMSRPRKRLTCCKPELTLPRSLTDIFDASYIYPPEEVKRQLDNPLLSPGLMPDDLVDRLPPVQLCLCEYDMLLAEGKTFAERLRGRGKKVGYRVVKEAKHAWDKPLPFSPPESMGVEYAEAVRAMAEWIGHEEGNGSGEDIRTPRENSGGGGGGGGGWGSDVTRDTVPENEMV